MSFLTKKRIKIIRRVLKTRFTRAMEIKIDEENLINLASTLVRIPSENPPGNEKEVAEFLASELRELGFKVFEYDFKPGRPNVIGYLNWGKGRKLMFDGHLDTVPAGSTDRWSTSPFSGEITDGKLYGRGAADMKASIAAWISAVEAVVNADAEMKGEILTCLVSDEEVSGLGTEDLLSKGYVADMAVVGEPTRLTLQVAHKGVVRWKLSTFGKAAHISSPSLGVNAIYKMAKVCQELDRYSKQLMKKKHRLLGSPTIAIGTIKGGEKDNIVPDYCEASVDRRLIPGEKPEEAELELTKLLESMKEKDGGFRYKLERYVQLEPSETRLDAEIVKIFRDAIRKETGKETEILGFEATCEMIHLVKRGIPTVIFGAGSLTQAHKIDEHVDVAEILTASKIYAESIIRVLAETHSNL